MNEAFKNAAIKRLKDQPDFVAYAQANQWATRRERGWSWQTNVFEFIATVYKDYLGNGLVQGDLRVHDPKLYAQLHKELSALEPKERKKKVEELNLPTASDAKMDALTDPHDKAILAAAREYFRVGNRIRRSIGKSSLDND